MLPQRLADSSKRLLLLVGLSSAAAVLPPTTSRAPIRPTSCASGFATATPASPSDAAAKHSYSPRPHLYERPPDHLRLKQVVVIARHGDRVPIARNVGAVIRDSPEQQATWQAKLPPQEEIDAWRRQYPPEDPDLVPLDLNEFPYSQLTVKGAEELRALGSHLRERYVDALGFLPSALQESTVYARATNIRRTQQSAANLLLGMYPEGSLSIEVRPTAEETLYPNADRSCRRQEEIITELRKKHYLLPDDEVAAYKALMKDSKQRLGLESFVPWNQVREVLTCYVVHGEEIPPPLDHEYVERVVAFTSKMLGQWFRHPEFLRLGIGPFLDELLQKMDTRVKGESPHHLLLYAGHDSTIVPVLAAFGLYDDVWPPYSAQIVLEVAHHESKPHEHWVRVIYNDQPQQWRPFKEFREEIRRHIPTNYEKECQCKLQLSDVEMAVKEDGVGSTIISSDDDKKKE